jgi:hypothetical protein
MAAGLELFSCSAAVACETQDEEERKKMAKKMRVAECRQQKKLQKKSEIKNNEDRC